MTLGHPVWVSISPLVMLLVVILLILIFFAGIVGDSIDQSLRTSYNSICTSVLFLMLLFFGLLIKLLLHKLLIVSILDLMGLLSILKAQNVLVAVFTALTTATSAITDLSATWNLLSRDLLG